MSALARARTGPDSMRCFPMHRRRRARSRALDRLGRSLGELLVPVEKLRSRRVALPSLEEKIDTNSAAGELVFHVFGAIAHFERRLIAERANDGIAAARAPQAARTSTHRCG
jgi:DNA invertase Pin-like site-specific DNA recombinase